MERWLLFLAFLSFHRRLIIGCLLVAGLLFFFFNVLPAIPRFDRGNRKSADAISAGQVSETDDGSEVIQSVPKSKQYFLETKDPEEVIQEAIRLRDSTAQMRSESAKMVIANERFQLAKRALELTPNLQQRRKIANELTLATLLLLHDRTENDSSFNPSEFLQVAKRLQGDTDDEVRSFSSVIFTASGFLDFRKRLTNEALNEYKGTIIDHFGQLVKQPNYLRQFCVLLTLDEFLSVSELDLQSVVDDLSKRMKESEFREVRQIGEDFAMSYGFQRLFPDQLVDDIVGSSDEKIDERVNSYFDQLAKYPDASIFCHQVALDTIKSYLSLNQRDRAAQCIDAFENRILVHRKDKKTAERIRVAFEELKKFYRESEPQ